MLDRLGIPKEEKAFLSEIREILSKQDQLFDTDYIIKNNKIIEI